MLLRIAIGFASKRVLSKARPKFLILQTRTAQIRQIKCRNFKNQLSSPSGRPHREVDKNHNPFESKKEDRAQQIVKVQTLI